MIYIQNFSAKFYESFIFLFENFWKNSGGRAEILWKNWFYSYRGVFVRFTTVAFISKFNTKKWIPINIISYIITMFNSTPLFTKHDDVMARTVRNGAHIFFKKTRTPKVIVSINITSKIGIKSLKKNFFEYFSGQICCLVAIFHTFLPKSKF